MTSNDHSLGMESNILACYYIGHRALPTSARRPFRQEPVTESGKSTGESHDCCNCSAIVVRPRGKSAKPTSVITGQRHASTVYVRLVTWSTRHRSTRHTSVSSHSQLVTSEHITKPPVVIYLSARRSGGTQKQYSTRTAYLRQACNIVVIDDGEALEWDEC